MDDHINIIGKIGRRIYRINSVPPSDWVDTPHIKSFKNDNNFLSGYKAACDIIGEDYRIEWRAHQVVWGAHHALTIPGDFVEIGTGRGFLMLCVLGSIDNWNNLQKKLWLYDVFKKSSESGLGDINNDEYYAKSVSIVKQSFSAWNRVNIIEGDVRDTCIYGPDKISFLHLDLNDCLVEIEVLKKIMTKISKGGVIVLDDYANKGMDRANYMLTNYFNEIGKKILTTPSGQGIIVN